MHIVYQATSIDYRSKEVIIPANDVIRFTLLYANEAQDIETLIVDPLSNDIYLVQKNWFGTRASIYKVMGLECETTAACI